MKPLHLKIKIVLALSLLLFLLFKVIDLPRIVKTNDSLTELGFSYHMPKSDFLPKFNSTTNEAPSHEKTFENNKPTLKNQNTQSHQDKKNSEKISKKIKPKESQNKTTSKNKKNTKQTNKSKNNQKTPGFTPYGASPDYERSTFNTEKVSQDPESKISPSNSEAINLINNKELQNDIDTDQNSKLSESEWKSLIFNSPQPETLKKFYEALIKKEVSSQFYFTLILELKDSTQVDLQKAAVLLLSLHMSYPSFILISEEINSKNEIFMSYKKNLIEPYNQSLLGIGILIQIVSKENTVVPVTLAINELSKSLDYQIQKQESSTGENTLPSLSQSPNGWQRTSRSGSYFPYKNLNLALDQFEKNPNWESSLLVQGQELKQKVENQVASLSIEKQNSRRTSLLKAPHFETSQ